MVVVPVVAGAWAWRTRPTERFGRLLIGVGLAWFLTTLAESHDQVAYSVGRVAGWMLEPALVYLVLSFPSGRLTERVDRVLFRAAVVLVGSVYIPLVLLTHSYPVPSPYTSCTASCPHNAFFALGSEPSVVGSLLLPLRELLTVVLALAVTARLFQRIRGASRLMRRTLAPVLTVALLRCFLLGLGLVVRRAAPHGLAIDVIVWSIALALPLMAVGLLLGFLSWDFYSGHTLRRLGGQLQVGLEPVPLQRALADALGDPALRVVLWSDISECWVDGDGGRVDAPRPGSAQVLTEVRDGDRRVAAIIHDAALGDKPEFLQAVASRTLLALQNRRLATEVQSSLHELQQSRARLLAAADAERRRIERDLHDGAQQRLVALRIQLELAEELIARDPQRGIQKVHTLGEEVGGVLDEIRALARGVYPSLLADRGLAEALRVTALHVPIPTSVDSNGTGRYRQDVESAVYFCCLEAIQNASKHAKDAHAINVALKEDHSLTFQVRDDGAGFDVAGRGSGAGLTNMRDRIVAVGGELSIRSSDGGTVVTGSVPVNGAA